MQCGNERPVCATKGSTGGAGGPQGQDATSKKPRRQKFFASRVHKGVHMWQRAPRLRNRGLYGWRGRCFLSARRKSGGFAPLSFLVQCSYEIPEESVPSNSRAPALCPLPTLSATNFSFRPPAGEKGVTALAAVTHTLVSNPHRLRAGLVQPALITSRTTSARGIAVTTVTHTLVSHQTRSRRI